MPPVQPRAADRSATLAETSTGRGSRSSGIGEYAYFRQPTLTTAAARVLVADGRLDDGRARRGSSRRAPASTCASTTSNERSARRPRTAELRDSDHVGRRRARVRARLERLRHELHADARAARLLRLHPVPRPEHAPMFDTAIDDFNFAQLFTVNRYLGNDRIGDANQLTLALTSRLLEPDTGAERLRVAVGQRFYFEDQRVVLNEAPRSASTLRHPASASRAGSPTRGRSRACCSTTSTRRRPSASTSASATRRRRAARFNASYRYLARSSSTRPGRSRADRSSSTCRAVAGRRRNWTLLGRWNYSLARQQDAGGRRRRRVQCRLLGAARSSASGSTTTVEQTNSSFYLQIELNGLARFGTSPLDLLRRSVPGYLQTNDPTLSPRDRATIRFRNSEATDDDRFAASPPPRRSRRRCARRAPPPSRSRRRRSARRCSSPRPAARPADARPHAAPASAATAPSRSTASSPSSTTRR